MSEFARFLVAAGISSSRFARISQLAYFRAASIEARFRNARVNQSAVAAMTGLTRSQVRALLSKDRSLLDVNTDRFERLIAAWTSDAEFITASFEPRRLRLTGPGPSFSTLAKRYGSDIPARSLLRELERQNLVAVNGPYVSLTNSARKRRELRCLTHLSDALAHVIRTNNRDMKSETPLRAVTMEVSYPAPSAAGRILMQRRLTKSIKAFLADIEAAGAAVAMESPAPIKRMRRESQAKLLFLTYDCEARDISEVDIVRRRGA